MLASGEEETTGGLLRLPHFLRSLVSVVKKARADQSTEELNVINPEASVNDVVACILFAAALFLLRVVLHRKVFPSLFARHPRNIRSKLSENLWYSLYYTATFAYYALVVYPNVEWSVDLFGNHSSVVRSLMHPIPPHMGREEHIYYVQAAGFYVSASAFLVLFDGRRSDFAELILHHVLSIGLVAVSYIYGYFRTGIVILALHDVGDIFLYTAKLVHYLGFAGLDTALFAVFAVVFYVTRLIMYPRLVYAVAVETLQIVVAEPSFNDWAPHFATYLWHYVFFVLFLGTLQLLHCFWFSLILKMIYREVVLGKKVSEEGDIRSDSEEENDSIEDENDKFFNVNDPDKLKVS